MEVLKAVFILSSPGEKKCPPPEFPEYAFIGRSNVGKSSLINMLTGNKKLAKTSAVPGKTRLINHFLINESWYLVDLPGLGYAKTGKQEKQKWEKMITQYFLRRKNLMNTFILVDSRLRPQKIDLALIDWMGSNELPFVILFTKTDKISQPLMEENLKLLRESLSETWEELPPVIPTSSRTALGKKNILDFIEETNRIFPGAGSGKSHTI